ncbi:hypothetical protein [Streptomyces sp. NBC_00385]|uniref:hypothetical protein n=1 Tax=Streptomyces sp. NBC_00385 TaxID=2975733 RepID=UPI002DD9916F|nr:hypothetical protein [Streptomyces sp. NBC_00385]WRZ04308.1 hypothetical protein OG959_13535 [Streptomyces sp. NBC_00385]
MIHHTMIVSFAESIQEAELDQFLKDIEQVMRDSEQIQTFAASRHIRVPAEDHSPVPTATAIVQIALGDLDALNASFAAPGLEEVIRHWQSRHPYKVIWANHEPLSS